MGEDKPGWYYVGTGKLRYNDGDGWTDQYQPIEGPRTETTPMVDKWSAPAGSNKSPDLKKPHRRSLPLVIALCVGLVVVGVGLAKPDVLHGAISWTTEQEGQISGLISPPAPATQTIAVKPVAKAKAKVLAKAKATAPKRAAPRPLATGLAVRPAAPAPAAPIQPKPNPGWDGHGYTKADYADRVGQVAVWVAYVREDSGLEMTIHTDLVALGNRFRSIGVMPAPPGVDPAWWAAETTVLSQSSQQVAEQWANGDQNAAMGGFEAIVEESHNLITKVNKAFGLHIALSKTAA